MKHNPLIASSSKDRSEFTKKIYKPSSSTSLTRYREKIHSYLTYYNGKLPSSKKVLTERDIIYENHKFIHGDDDDNVQSYEKKLTQEYYKKLYKEYALCQFEKEKLGLRWRTYDELISGKGQFCCGEIKCTENKNLKVIEVNFRYKEEEIKHALVKLTVCKNHFYKLKKIKKKEY
ncbi:hypothetical protein PCANB_000617 [Pneumocystis canis]|nr:hypothetical protein PCK1_000713 [Pneumocystis canis]KAG5437582.1 hypothetical protein PCANB_000617 [Pneumocystis canis]